MRHLFGKIRKNSILCVALPLVVPYYQCCAVASLAAVIAILAFVRGVLAAMAMSQPQDPLFLWSLYEDGPF